MSRLYGRKVVVEVGKPGQAGRSWSELRCTFRVKRNLSRTPNEAVIELYNLTGDSTAACQEDGAVVRLSAGYDLAKQLFLGDILRAYRVTNGADAVTTIEAKDGGRAFQRARVTKTFAAELTLKEIVKETAKSFGIPVPDHLLEQLPDLRIPSGRALNDFARNILDQAADMAGVDWSIQDGELLLLADDQDTGDDAVVISPDSGLVGSPVPIKQEGQRKPGLEVVSLLQPEVTPGRRFRLESEQYTGVYRAREVEHVGDTHAQDFYTRIVATEA